MEQNHCSRHGFPIDTILAGFDPEVIFLLQSKFWVKATKGLEKDVKKLIFKMVAILDFQSAQFKLFCVY